MSILINRRFFGDKDNPKNKHGTIITSTPIKKKTVQQMEMEWLSPVEKNSNKSPNPHVPVRENKSLKKIAESESVDEICLANRFPEMSNIQEVMTPNNVDVESKIKNAKQLTVMDSDEEEIFWQNRNKPLKRKESIINENQQLTDSPRSTKKKKTQEQVESVSTERTVEETVKIDSQDHGILLPKNTVDLSEAVAPAKKPLKKKSPAGPLSANQNTKRLKSTLKIFKDPRVNESAEDSGRSTIVEPLQKAKEKMIKDDESTVRRSNRQRCKPLEFWNGQRMNIDRDFTTGIDKTAKNVAKRKVQRIEGSEKQLEREGLEQGIQIPTETLNSLNTHESEPSLTEKSETKKNKSILKSKTRSKANVTFSAIGTGTTIDGPKSKINMKPDWLVNFTGLHSAKELLSASENCLVFPGLNTAMGIVSSAVIRMRPKAMNQSRAPDLHHLMFCVMVGTVTVMIDEISVRIETYGHFCVPCGISYSIENIGKKEAILSFFKVACSCVSK